jgi:hypothetical protein
MNFRRKFMNESVFNNFEDFLKTKAVYKVDSFQEDENIKGIINEGKVEEHLKLICEFHNKTMGFSGFLNKRINNYTGKSVEEFKVYIKRLRRDIKRIQEETVRTEVEECILEHGEKYLERAERCISQIYEWGYYDLIDRSMKRTEICVGNSYHDNIRKDINGIEILDMDHLGYNMIENDCVFYFTKLRKRGADLDWRKLTSKFCEYEGLGSSSEAFILSMVSYPHEFMRSVNRYKYRKKEWTEEKYKKSIIAAAKSDGDSLID